MLHPVGIVGWLVEIFVDDDSRHAAQNCRSKQGNIQRLQTELNSMEQQATSVQQQIDSCITELNVCDFTLFADLWKWYMSTHWERQGRKY